MSNSTTTYWDLGGTSLNQYAWSIETLGGSRSGVPSLRGEDASIAYLPGRRFRAKVPDSRIISLVFHVIGTNVTTDAYVSDPIVRFTNNFKTLQRLMWGPGVQKTLTKRWIETGTTVLSASALVQQVGPMEPTMSGPARAVFAADFLLSDPFFYSAAVTSTLVLSTPQSVTNSGDDQTTGYGSTLTFNGPLTNPVVTNSTTSPAVWVQFNGSISGGDSVVLNLRDYTATRTSDSANMIGSITHSGSRQWMGLLQGANTLTLTASSGSGTAVFVHRPPIL